MDLSTMSLGLTGHGALTQLAAAGLGKGPPTAFDPVLDVLSWLCLLSGAFLVLISGLGLLRLPDFYSRIHAAGITDTLGTGLVLAGLAFQIPLSLVTVKLIMLLAFLALTGPLAAHALAKTAHLHGVSSVPSEDDEDDEDDDKEGTPSRS